jgi:glycosyltransferase involved in cell wall biosynthesis
VSRPLNFLHLTTFYPPYSFGGDAMYLYRLSHALGEAGHHVDIIHCIDAYQLLHPAEPEMKFEGHPNVTPHGLQTGYGWLSPLYTHQTGRCGFKRKHITHFLNSKSYDVMHYHNISLLGPEVLTLVPHQSRVVKMYTAHEHWLICPMHVLWKYNKRLCDKPDCFRCMILSKRPPQIWRYTDLLKKASQHVDQFVSPSRFTALMHAERGFQRPMAHLSDFMDRVDEDWKKPGPRPQEKPYFLFVGRLEPIKGLQTLIDIWDSLPDFDLLVLGAGNQENELRAKAGSNSCIKFLGALPQRDLGALYYHALACIVPSVTCETFGMIIIESFARKTPAIVRDLGALPEIIHDSGGGFVYHTNEELLGAIRRIAASQTLRDELGEKGYRAFIEHWSREAHLKLYFDFLRRTATHKFGYIPWER